MKYDNAIERLPKIHTIQPTLTLQPEFPSEDLTVQNAAFFNDFLKHHSLVSASQAESEPVEQAFQIAYQATPPSDRLTIPDRLAVAHGYTLHEVISTLVRPESSDPLEHYVGLVATEWLATAIKRDSRGGALLKVADEISHEQPQTASIIETAAKQVDPSTTKYALAGAAIKRQAQIDTLHEQSKYSL